MVEPIPPPTPPSGGDREGVRVVSKARAGFRPVLFRVLAIALVLGAAISWNLRPPNAPAPAASQPLPSPAWGPTAAARALPSAKIHEPADALPNDDPNDLANYFQPGDPEPTGAELIGALHDVGVRTGIGAFNPPGTSPPLEGLAVPADFELPEGYVRHHQSSDDGVSIEPILMFAPDFTLRDASGRPIAMPENRVVPPELAPPGLPLRRVRIPPP